MALTKPAQVLSNQIKTWRYIQEMRVRGWCKTYVLPSVLEKAGVQYETVDGTRYPVHPGITVFAPIWVERVRRIIQNDSVDSKWDEITERLSRVNSSYDEQLLICTEMTLDPSTSNIVRDMGRIYIELLKERGKNERS